MTPPEKPLSISDVSGASLLRLARASRDAARKKLRGMPAEAQARACLELRPEVRGEFLMLLDHPEEVVPLFADAEVCTTIRSCGMTDGAWLLEIATPAQTQACFDLDCWTPEGLEGTRVVEWVDALIEAGPERLASAVHETDREIWVLLMSALSAVTITGKEEEPPDGAISVDGQVHFLARDRIDPARIQAIAAALFAYDQTEYWSLVYGILFESPSEAEMYAERWRSGRLADLGFPEREDALRVYARLRVEEAPLYEVSPPGESLVPVVDLPRQLSGSLVGEALQKLPPAVAGERLGDVLAVANAIAVADDLVLSDAGSVPTALEKAVRGIDGGLRAVAAERGRPVEDVLERTRPLNLFRIGATLDPTLRKIWSDPDADADAEDDADDEAVEP